MRLGAPNVHYHYYSIDFVVFSQRHVTEWWLRHWLAWAAVCRISYCLIWDVVFSGLLWIFDAAYLFELSL